MTAAPMSNDDVERLLVERRYATADRRAAIEAEFEAAGIRVTDLPQGVRWERV